jgi:hypothetical protein
MSKIDFQNGFAIGLTSGGTVSSSTSGLANVPYTVDDEGNVVFEKDIYIDNTTSVRNIQSQVNTQNTSLQAVQTDVASIKNNLTDYAKSEDIKTEVETALAEAKTSGEFKGDKGDPFTYEDFAPEQLEALKGKDGYTPVKGVDYFDGDKGADGYTPIKGTDYFTEEEKAELVNAVLASLPKWSGGAY